MTRYGEKMQAQRVVRVKKQRAELELLRTRYDRGAVGDAIFIIIKVWKPISLGASTGGDCK
jgi:hypothetical protein